ncbi:MAG: hypothetical protein AAGF11_48570 [Myxococcota bacterium]
MSIESYRDRELNRANALLAIVNENAPKGTICTPIERSMQRCRFRVFRPELDEKPIVIAYSLVEAVHSEVFADPDARRWWTKYTADMLWAACVRRVAHGMFPHVIQNREQTVAEEEPRSPSATLADVEVA